MNLSAVVISVLEGTQPLLIQVPPTVPLSTSATFRPSADGFKSDSQPCISRADDDYIILFHDSTPSCPFSLSFCRVKIRFHIDEDLDFRADHEPVISHWLVPCYAIVFAVYYRMMQ